MTQIVLLYFILFYFILSKKNCTILSDTNFDQTLLLVKDSKGITSWSILSEFGQSNVAMSLMINY